MNNNRNWTILFIGGASGTGKSSLAYELRRYYNINVMEVDDIHLAVKASTLKDSFPAIHYWDSGINWKDIGVSRNIEWLINVSKELIPAIKAIAEDHLETKIPVIIEGDFLYPEFIASFKNPCINSVFLHEPDKKQLVQNYFNREGGESQDFRAEVSVEYSNWLFNTCNKLGINVIEPRPYNTALKRIIEYLK